jgi:predicted N-acetyltransferase YhbS
LTIEIQFLADCTHTLTTLASWLYQEWPHRSPDGSESGMEAILTGRLNQGRLPIALVALDNGHPVGTVSLKVREIESRPQYENWLGTLYVPPDCRRRGIGSLLVHVAEETAWGLGIGCLYLYTRHPTTEAIYARLGWERIQVLDYAGRPAIIMRKHNELY